MLANAGIEAGVLLTFVDLPACGGPVKTCLPRPGPETALLGSMLGNAGIRPGNPERRDEAMAPPPEDPFPRRVLALWLTAVLVTFFSAVFLDWINPGR